MQRGHYNKRSAYLDACSNSRINQLLLIPCVILDFLCIHPFRDGNGRMSRILSLLLLYKNGFDAGKYISFEEQINRYKDLYYDALQRSSAGWDMNKNDYFPFMQNFLSALYMCYKELDKRFAVVHGKRVTKTARIEATVLGSLIPVSKAEICAIHPDISPTTVEAVLGRMVKEGSVKRIGASRGSSDQCDYLHMPRDNSVNKNAVIYAAHTTFGVRNMPLIIFTKVCPWPLLLVIGNRLCQFHSVFCSECSSDNSLNVFC